MSTGEKIISTSTPQTGTADRTRPAIMALLGAALIWSTSFVTTKIALVDIPPLTLGALRFILAALVLVLV